MIKRLIPVWALLAIPLCAQLRVVTTIPDLADLATRIGGDAVRADSLTEGHEDMHMVRVRPSFLIRLRQADVFIQLGLDAEHAWVPSLLRKSRNRKVRPGGTGFCNASHGITALEVPERRTRADGPDIHPNGNPHFNLDPRRMRTAARNVRDVLKQAEPGRAKEFDARCAKWEAELDLHWASWQKKLAPFRGAAFVEYHASWVYFADAFGLKIVGRLEPKPGLAPTPGHLARVIEAAKRHRVGLVVARPQNADVARRVARDGGGAAVVLQLGSTSSGRTTGWFTFMDHVVETFATHLKKP